MARSSVTGKDQPQIDQQRQINQFLPHLSFGDAISNCALWIREELRAFGYRSDIYVRCVDPEVAHEVLLFSPDALPKSDAVIYHHSIGSEITSQMLNYEGPKCLFYHNITPAEFFEPYQPEFAHVLRRGREDLAKLADNFPISFGVSRYNAAELETHGFAFPGVLPIPVDPEKWAVAPDTRVMAELQDGTTNILFVGRIVPNKKQDDLVFAFDRYLNLDSTARLILVGKYDEQDPYFNDLKTLVDVLGLSDCVIFARNVTDAELAAYYRTAHLFWSMSEHEGFCVPLVEAMWFDVPILAYRSSGVPETLGQAGLLFTEKDDLSQLAALAQLVITDSALRQKILKAQRERRTAFLPGKVRPILQKLVDRLFSANTETCLQHSQSHDRPLNRAI